MSEDARPRGDKGMFQVALLKFLDLMTGDWAFVPIAVATFITALIYDFFQKIRNVK